MFADHVGIVAQQIDRMTDEIREHLGNLEQMRREEEGKSHA